MDGADGGVHKDRRCGRGTGLPRRGRRDGGRLRRGGAERPARIAGGGGRLGAGAGAVPDAGQSDGGGDGDAADAGDGLCGGAGQPAVGVQVRHRGWTGGERDIRLRAWRFPQLEQLCGAEHRQLRRRQRLGRTLYRGGGLHGRRGVLQGELHGAHLSGSGRRAPDRDGAVQRRAEGCGEDRGRGGRCGVLSGERRGVRL